MHAAGDVPGRLVVSRSWAGSDWLVCCCSADPGWSLLSTMVAEMI